MFKRVGVVVAVSAIGISPSLAASCSISRFEFVFGTDAQSTVMTRPGARCVGHINGRSALSSGSVSQPPQHGTAFVSEHQFG